MAIIGSKHKTGSRCKHTNTAKMALRGDLLQTGLKYCFIMCYTYVLSGTFHCDCCTVAGSGGHCSGVLTENVCSTVVAPGLHQSCQVAEVKRTGNTAILTSHCCWAIYWIATPVFVPQNVRLRVPLCRASKESTLSILHRHRLWV